jgi:hypothetical protein
MLLTNPPRAGLLCFGVVKIRGLLAFVGRSSKTADALQGLNGEAE